jgi:multicomponent Na+:H+ antiporter subunit C
VSAYLLYALAGAFLFALGTFGVVVRSHLIHKVVAANFMGSGVFLVLIGLARRDPRGVTDPVPQAMVLTGIVVTVALTALALALVKRHFSVSGLATLDGTAEDGEGT